MAVGLAIQPMWGWGTTGHRIIARFAAARITDAGVRDRILAALDGEADSTCRQNDLAERLACVSTWADEIRRTTMPFTRNWHFVNIPREATSYDAARDCKDTPNGDCVINAAIRQRIAALGVSLTPKARAEALKFVVHFVSDLHQPLHAIEDSRDAGGNFKQVVWFGEAETQFGHWNLHGVWDDGIISKSPNLKLESGNSADVAYTKVLLKREALARSGAFSGEKVIAWAMESHDAGARFTYGTLPPAKQGSLAGPEKTDRLYYTLGAEYEQANIAAVELQLQRAGERLADVLNSMYAAPQP